MLQKYNIIKYIITRDNVAMNRLHVSMCAYGINIKIYDSSYDHVTHDIMIHRV